jgi:hypothetical protein
VNEIVAVDGRAILDRSGGALVRQIGVAGGFLVARTRCGRSPHVQPQPLQKQGSTSSLNKGAPGSRSKSKVGGGGG